MQITYFDLNFVTFDTGHFFNLMRIELQSNIRYYLLKIFGIRIVEI